MEATAKYTCNTGFVLHGVEVRECQSDGVWSGSEPVCSSKKPNMFNQLVNYVINRIMIE